MSKIFSPPPGRDNPMYVNGLGAVTGFGWGVDAQWKGFESGESAVTLQSGFEEYADSGEVYIAMIPEGGRQKAGWSRFMKGFDASANEAIADALARGWVPGPSVGVIHNTVFGDIGIWREYYNLKRRVRPRQWVNMMPSTVFANLVIEHHFTGPTMGLIGMCAGGNIAAITAKMWLDTGFASDVIIVGTDISGEVKEGLNGFVDLGVSAVDAPAYEACRPFQEGSRGFVAGEASVSVVVSNQPNGARASILGGSSTNDGYHATTIDPSWEQIRLCYHQALKRSGVDASEIAYINAHGPGTKNCDAAEAAMFDEIFPDAHGMFAVKPVLGHCLGAASNAEWLATLYAYETGFIPAPPLVSPGHPRLITGRTACEPGLMFKSALGMGGFNSGIIFAPPE
jgi:3-oxoacyl-[acyl-carrier-protein] synthase II